MDYEKAYKDALERAKSFELQEYKNIMASVFPELKESEDELTWLTKYIEEEAYSLSIDIRDNEDRIKLKNLQKALAWLEKQKQFKLNDEDVEMLNHISIALPKMAIGNIEMLPSLAEKYAKRLREITGL